jgi:hypothetical protein
MSSNDLNTRFESQFWRMKPDVFLAVEFVIIDEVAGRQRGGQGASEGGKSHVEQLAAGLGGQGI